MGDPTNQSAVSPPGRGLFIRGVIGALAGAALGYWLYFYCLRRGVLFLPMPGALIGGARDLATRHRSWALGAICAALALGVQGYIVQSTFTDGFSGMQEKFWAAFIAGIAFAFWFGIGKVLPAKENPKE